MVSEFLGLIVLPFIVWVISWWGYICGKLSLGTDAYYYYWDSRFFLENISHGVYPLWNPTYSGGVPWNFFLRRMGEVNPFYWVISVFKLFGLLPLHAYLAFLVFYYFWGAVGFWLLARLFLKDRLTSIGAYLLLLFSWGTQIFYCFDVFTFVPLVWFFYFIFAYAKQKKKHQFLGIFFTPSLLVTTYIPFFALTILGSFFFFFFLFFRKECLVFFKTGRRFMHTHKLLAVLSFGFFLWSCSHEAGFYFESRQGGFVMPSRHVGSADKSQVAFNVKITQGFVDVQTPVWDIIAHDYFDKVFADQKGQGIGDFNIAYPFFLVLFLGVVNPASRRVAVLLVSGVFITLIATTHSRLYPWLSEHVFFFRYMRMLQLFFWLAVLPMAILMAMESLRVFLRDHQGRREPKILVFVIAVHVLFLAWLWAQKGIVWSSYLAVAVSLVFFILSLMGRGRPGLLCGILWFSLIIQPISFAYYIEHMAVAHSYFIDHLSFYQHRFLLPEKASWKPVSEALLKQPDVVRLASAGYYENPWIDNLRRQLDPDNIKQFMSNQLVLFDNSMPEDPVMDEKFYSKLIGKWRALGNTVFLPWEGSAMEDFRSLSGAVKAQVVYQGSSMVRVQMYDANTLGLETNFERPRFLLWADGYHPSWHVYIDGMEKRLLRADYAFKGTWVPSGEHTVVFRFEKPLRYAAAYLLLLAYVLVLAALMVWGFRERIAV